MRLEPRSGICNAVVQDLVAPARLTEGLTFIATALGRPLASKVGQAGGWDSSTGQRLI